jgi:hypothetical protein
MIASIKEVDLVLLLNQSNANRDIRLNFIRKEEPIRVEDLFVTNAGKLKDR